MIAVLGVLVAILGVLSAWLGYREETIASQKDQVQSSADGNIADLQRQVDDVKRQNSVLQAENDRLEGRPATLANATPAPSGLPAGTVRHAGPLLLISQGRADLDAPPNDPKWTPGSLDIALQFDGSLGVRSGSAQSVFLGSTKADYNSCSQNVRFQYKGVDRGQLTPGAYICIKTDENRYSALQVVTASREELSLNVETYDPPYEN